MKNLKNFILFNYYIIFQIQILRNIKTYFLNFHYHFPIFITNILNQYYFLNFKIEFNYIHYTKCYVRLKIQHLILLHQKIFIEIEDFIVKFIS